MSPDTLSLILLAPLLAVLIGRLVRV